MCAPFSVVLHMYGNALDENKYILQNFDEMPFDKFLGLNAAGLFHALEHDTVICKCQPSISIFQEFCAKQKHVSSVSETTRAEVAKRTTITTAR